MIDDSGITTWHFPEEQTQAGAPTRGAGATNTFVIPYSALPGEPAKPEPDSRLRSLGAAIGRKVIKVLVYPVTDRVLGPITEKFARHWEEKKRPNALRTFTRDNYQAADVPALSGGEWKRLRGGRALLFIHGTFSTAHSAFRELPVEVLAALNQRYNDRVFAFNHPSLGQDPVANARWFIEQIPNEIRLELDIVCHSRGGLVARCLAREMAAPAAAKGTINRIVFVGAPNGGTVLADADHITNMIDRFTTVLSLLPTGNPAEIFEGIVCAVKVLGHGMLNGLPGILSMKPGGSFLSDLDSFASPDHGSPEYFAITSDYSPKDRALVTFLCQSVKNKMVDRIFGQTANDMVVPTRGVFEVEKAANFPIASERIVTFGSNDGVTHTTYFKEQKTAEALLRWLA